MTNTLSQIKATALKAIKQRNTLPLAQQALINKTVKALLSPGKDDTEIANDLAVGSVALGVTLLKSQELASIAWDISLYEEQINFTKEPVK